MATCTDAEKALLDAWMKGVSGDEFRRARTAVLRERITGELRAELTMAWRQLIRSARQRDRLWKQLCGQIAGCEGKELGEIWANIEADAQALETPDEQKEKP